MPGPPERVATRLPLGLLAGLAAGLVAWARWDGIVGFMVGWCVAASTVDALAWWLILVSDPERTRERAGKTDPGAGLVLVLDFVAATGAALSLVPVLDRAQSAAPFPLLVFLCLWAAFSGWVLTHTSFALRYAHLYYREEPEPAWGLEFPRPSQQGKLELEDRSLADLDFAYFAFTIGVSCAVSDVQVVCPRIRAAVLLHSVVSFVFNTAILALVLNLVAGRLS